MVNAVMHHMKETAGIKRVVTQLRGKIRHREVR